MARCPYGKCDVDAGDEYCEGCLKDLREHEALAEKVKRLPLHRSETPEGQRQIEEAVQQLGEGDLQALFNDGHTWVVD